MADETIDNSCRQVRNGVDDVSVSGSNVSGGSMKSIVALKNLKLAKLKENRIKADIELQRKALDIELETEAAKIEAEAAMMEDNLLSRPNVPAVNEFNDDRLHSYLDDCNIEFGRSLKIMEPERQTSTISDKRDLPKVELTPFDGDPVKYWKFIQQFVYYVERKESDDGQRLLYLIYYCRGKAREAIDECVGLPPSVGYSRARRILERLFGQRHRVARAIIDGILPGNKIVPNTSDALERLSIKMENCEIALTQMNYLANLNSTDTTEMVVRALPLHLQTEWAKVAYRTTAAGQEPTFHQLASFVSECAGILGSRFGYIANESEVKGSRSSRIHLNYSDQPRRMIDSRRSVHLTNKLQEPSQTCPLCNDAHDMHSCEQFKSLNVDDRWKSARQLGICFSCLKSSHIAYNCSLKTRCGIDGCKSLHNRLLHINSDNRQNEISGAGVCGATCVNKLPRLGIIPVELETPIGLVRTCAFVDSGSDVTLVKKSFLNTCRIQGTTSSLTIATVNGVTTTTCTKACLRIRSVGGNEAISVDNAYSVPDLPMRSVKSIKDEASKWHHLADIEFHDGLDDEVAILLGCDIPEAHWILDQRIGGRRQPFAIKTVLGWTMCGPLTGTYKEQSVHLLSLVEDRIEEQIRTMYDAEFGDTSTITRTISREDELALAMVQSASLDEDHHFQVPLPWKSNRSQLENNYKSALHRLTFLKRKFLRNPELFDNYAKVIERHIKMGYLEKVPIDGKPHSSSRWYLPHHAVYHPKKPGKLRVVFDCAAKFRGLSLNDVLYQGPDLNTSLIDVIMRFRLESIAISADIEEMFLQVRIPVSDRSMFRVLWWSGRDLTTEPVEYQLTVHPFGATSSPFCATFALQTTVDKLQSNYAMSTCNAVLNNFYVDDCLISIANVEEAKRFICEITELLSKGGFRLCKWVSNSRKVLMSIPTSELAPSVVDFGVGPIPSQQTLGMQWDADEDVFCINFQLPTKPITRRGILSCISSLYDPMGLVSPWLLPGKQLLQRLTKRNIGWDEPIDVEEERKWLSWLDNLKKLGSLRIPRCLKPSDDFITDATELHLFCDASEIGYGAVAYGCFTALSGTRHVALLYSKARVAPTKAVSIPRLELAAAVLAVRLRELIGNAIGHIFHDIYFWTDSMIVLYYIHDMSSRFCTFVSNRLSIIHQASSTAQWSHVPTEINPADLTSRGAFDDKRCDTWLQGPEFLQHTRSAWPQKPNQFAVPQNVEFKVTSQTHVTCRVNSMSKVFQQCSDWTKLLRMIAWLIRFRFYWIKRSRNSSLADIQKGPLQVEELRTAERTIIRIIQEECFHKEIAILSESYPKPTNAPRQSQLKNLCPHIVEGTLRVGSRLSVSNCDFDLKYPIILPKRHHIVDLIILHYHRLEGHCGPSHVLSSIRKKFWIVDGASVVKRKLNTCITCRRLNAHMGSQLMAPLPRVRSEPGWHPFTNVGLDYFGPIAVKKGRGVEKRYGCLFTCLQSRAVHIEVAHSLTTDSFMMCLTRFVARRGKPVIIYSDNGSNFVAADKELKAWLRSTATQSLTDKLVNKGIDWNFNPPYASHRGGVWERLIRSTRRILNAVCKQETLSDEALSTLLVESERILNNRPIVKASSDDPDKIALTPNDLLLFKDNSGLTPETNVMQIYSNGWKHVQHLITTFWKRWSTEYLQLLHTRQRWINRARNFKIGDVVIVASEGMHRMRWPLGVVCSCETGSDGLVRTVELKVNGGIIRRDIRNLCLIEEAVEHEKGGQEDTTETGDTTFAEKPGELRILRERVTQNRTLSSV